MNVDVNTECFGHADAQMPPLIAALRVLDELLAIGVVHLHAIQGADPFRGLHIGAEEVEQWLDTATANEADPIWGDKTGEVALRAVTIALEDAGFHWLVKIYDLTAFQAAVLLIALAPELDVRYERLYAYLQDDIARKRPSVDLITRLLCEDRTSRIGRMPEFTGSGALVLHRLIAVERNPGAALLACPVYADEQIVALLLRQDHVDTRLASICHISVSTEDFSDLPIPNEWRVGLVALLCSARTQRQPLRLHLQGIAGSGKSALAGAIARHLKTRLMTVHVPTILELPDFGERLRLIFREAWLKGGVLHFTGVDALSDGEGQDLATFLRVLATDQGVTILSGHRPWRSPGTDQSGVVSLVFEMTPADLQVASWRRALMQSGIRLSDRDLEILAGRFRLTPAQAREATFAAVASIRWRNATMEQAVTPTLNDLFAAARRQCGHELAELAQRIEPKRSWSDIVLTGESLDQLREICARVSLHTRVLSEWGFARRLSHGKGVTALFAGPSGTGKTLAAEIVAYELGLYLYKIDLSGVVSKYIGETEKNLDRIFTAARDANCVLFFDEADALFGKRSEVRDSHDRYANLEISYLLQKMEEFEGLAILATNLRQNLDDAFTRRLAFTVHFPFPDEQERCRIWSEIWPKAVPLADDVDAVVLARELKMSGGNIKNTALAAAYYAAADGGVVTHAHLLRAARREFQKMGKVPANLGKAMLEGAS